MTDLLTKKGCSGFCIDIFPIDYASNNKFVPNEGVEVSDDYVESVKKIVSNRINMSKKIIDTDYYRKVFK